MKRIISLFLALMLAASSITLFASAETSDTDSLLEQWKTRYAYKAPGLGNYKIYSYKAWLGKLSVSDGWIYAYKREFNTVVDGVWKEEYSKTPLLIGYIGSDTDVTVPTLENGEKVKIQCIYSLSPIKTLRISKDTENLKGSLFDNVFYFNSDSLEEIIVDKDNKKYSSKDGVLYSKDGKEALLYPNGKKDEKFTLPTGVKTLDWNFISGAKYLKELVIPEGVKEIRRDSINSESIEKLYFKNDSFTVYNLAKYGLSLKTPNATVYCHKGSAVDLCCRNKLDSDALYKKYKSKIPNVQLNIMLSKSEYKNLKYFGSSKTPKAPEVDSAVYTLDGLTFTFKEYVANGIKIYRKSGSTYKYIGYTTGETFCDKTAKAGKTYTYKLRAYNKKDSVTKNSKYTSPFKVTAKPKSARVKHTTHSSARITFTFKEYSATGVKIYRKSGNKYKYIGYTTSDWFADKSVKSGKTYTYKFRTYIKENGKTVYSDYSVSKKIKAARYYDE